MTEKKSGGPDVRWIATVIAVGLVAAGIGFAVGLWLGG